MTTAPLLQRGKRTALTAVATGLFASILPATGFSQDYPGGTSWSQGWKVLEPSFPSSKALDVLSLEWDYFQVHDHNSDLRFVVGFVLSNPRAVLGEDPKVLPTGANLAVVSSGGGWEPHSTFTHFPLQDFSGDASDLLTQAGPNSSDSFVKIVSCERPSPECEALSEETLILTGQDQRFSWNLRLEPSSEPIAPTRGDDVGYLPGEHWTVHALGLRIRVQGEIFDTLSGETKHLDTWGYRERSFGQYAVVPDGWDFHVGHGRLTDGPAAGGDFSFTLQTYHKSSQLDFAEALFTDENGQEQHKTFSAEAGQISLNNSVWGWSETARQCMPRAGSIVLNDGEHQVEVNFTSNAEEEQSLLSDLTVPVSLFVIQYRFPQYSATISRADGTVLGRFANRGIAEFSYARRLLPEGPTPVDCQRWGARFGRYFSVR